MAMEMIIRTCMPTIMIIGICYVSVLVSIGLDLWSGIRKAKKAGLARMSKGYRRTVEKICTYYNGLFILGVIDSIIVIVLVFLRMEGMAKSIPLLPCTTILGSLYVAYIEGRSIFEKLEDKQKSKIEEDAKLFREVLKDKDRVDKVLKMIIESNKKEENDA